MLLIVDDEQDSRIILSLLLNRLGYKTAVAASGTEALALLRQCIPSLVILDVDMPNMSGLELLQTIKARQEWNNMRVLMFSAGSHSRCEAERLGADDFMVKGRTTFDALMVRISELSGESFMPH